MMQNKEQKIVNKKIYGLIVESSKNLFLSVQSAFSLEEAFMLAKLEFEKLNSTAAESLLMDGAKIGLFTIKTFDELNSDINPITARDIVIEKGINIPVPANKKLTKKESKNILMKQIIRNKDMKTFTKNKFLFTAPERKYIESKINLDK